MAQPTVELARRFAFVAIALAEQCDSAFKLGGSGRRFLEPTDGLQQLRQQAVVTFFDEQGIVRALVLEGCLVALTSCFSAGIHTASPYVDQIDFSKGIIAGYYAHPDLSTTTNHVAGPHLLNTKSAPSGASRSALETFFGFQSSTDVE
jgi:hypothetical protein